MQAYETPQEEMRRLQRKLIPVNIVVIILSIVAAISFFFMPLLRVSGDISEMIPAESEQTGGESEESGSSANSPAAMLQGVKIDLSLSGMDLVKLGFTGDLVEFAADKVGAMLSDQASDLAANVLLTAAAQQTGAEVTPETVEAMSGALDGLEKADPNDRAAVDAAIDKVIDAGAAYFAPESAGEDWDRTEIRNQIREMYDTTITENEGTFSTEALICVQISKMNESGASGEGGDGESGGSEDGAGAPSSGKVYTNFSDLAGSMLGEMMGGTGTGAGGESTDPFASMPWLMPVIGGVFLVLGLVWVILALFALLHLFAKNKRFTMWYVKLLGFLPCLLFGIAPLVAGKFLGGEVAAVFGMISTLAWIGGACYLLLWIVSIFWAFPIKRKIRRLKKETA